MGGYVPTRAFAIAGAVRPSSRRVNNRRRVGTLDFLDENERHVLWPMIRIDDRQICTEEVSGGAQL